VAKKRFSQFFNRRKVREFAIDSYESANGDQNKAKGLFEARCTAYGMDPATIAMLIISVIRFWLWLKDQGFLSKVPRDVGYKWLTEDKGFLDACEGCGITEADEQ
jgi:hypothetical protein